MHLRREKKFSVVLFGCSDAHLADFNDLQEHARAATRLAHCDPSKRLCIYKDSSHLFWTFCTTKRDYRKPYKSDVDQKHEPVSFLSGAFSEGESRWIQGHRC